MSLVTYLFQYLFFIEINIEINKIKIKESKLVFIEEEKPFR